MRSLRLLRRFLRPHWRWAALAPLLMALEVAMDLLQPRLLQHIIDVGIAQRDADVVLTTGAWMAAVALIGLVGGLGCTVAAVLAGIGLGTDLRRDLFGKVQALSFGNLDRLETGSIITRVTNDITQVQELAMLLLRIMVRAPLLLVGSLVMGVVTSPRLALLFLVLAPAVLLIMAFVVRKTFPLFGAVQERTDRLNTVVQENLSGVRVVKAFARATHEIGRFAGVNDELMAHNLRAARVNAVTMPLMMLTVNAGIVATLWVGGGAVAEGELRVGQVVAFTNYLLQTMMSLMMVSMLVLRASRAEASARRICEVFDETPDTRAPSEPRPLDACGSVAWESCTLRYLGADSAPALRDVSLTVAAGEIVAVLGATGSGKSSLVHLAPRFYDASEGRIEVDGADVREVDEGDLRRAVAVALQEPILFSGTIEENILYGRPDASGEEVRQAARDAQAHDFIAAFPDGYATVVGRRGVNLSGGQKQRIAIARALVQRTPVLILDDATSAVDVETESRILSALARDRGRRACIIVAQRISTALLADRIVVLEDGRVESCGTHADLLRTSPLYRGIYRSQVGDDGEGTDGR
ncbi:MAG TPA: ABC transporter ATP-binding protein [Chthonomonadales bacterium]|nr:ABC transporter ATP-binding protein [Chthonomonadales bacterium]